MGMEIVVRRAPESLSLPGLLAALGAAGCRSAVMMVDGRLVPPGAPLPPAWGDLRLRTPGGTVTLAARPGAIAVVVFGNADPALVAAQQQVARTLERLDTAQADGGS